MTHTLICRKCQGQYEVATLLDAWPWCLSCMEGAAEKKRRSSRIDDGPGGSNLERQFAKTIELVDDAACLRSWRRNFVFDARREWEIDFAWPERRLGVELQGGQWVGGATPGAGRGRHTRGGKQYRDELAKHRAAALGGWMILSYTTDDIVGKSQGLDAVLETAAAYRFRPPWPADAGQTPHGNAWEAAGRAIRGLVDQSDGLTAELRIASCLLRWRDLMRSMESSGGQFAAFAAAAKSKTESPT